MRGVRQRKRASEYWENQHLPISPRRGILHKSFLNCSSGLRAQILYQLPQNLVMSHSVVADQFHSIKNFSPFKHRSSFLLPFPRLSHIIEVLSRQNSFLFHIGILTNAMGRPRLQAGRNHASTTTFSQPQNLSDIQIPMEQLLLNIAFIT